MLSKISGLVLIFILFIISGCGARTAPEIPEAKKATEVVVLPVVAPVVTEVWEAEWERVQKEARKEGKVVIYSTYGPAFRRAFTEAMKEYGIRLEMLTGRGAELSEKILRERMAGIYNTDLFMSGLATFVTILKPTGCFAPLEPLLLLPEVKDPKLWYGGKLPFIDKDRLVVNFTAMEDYGIHINTDMVKPGEIKSMQDLLSPKWKGKIVISDPLIVGRGQKSMSVITLRLGEGYVKQLVEQESVLTRDLRLLTEWVARGKYSIGIGIRSTEYKEFKELGAPITHLVLPDIAFLDSGMGNVGFIDKAPNPNATKVFLNYLLSRKGQTLWQEIVGEQSARIDIPTDAVEKAGLPVRRVGVDYYEVRSETWEVEDRPRVIPFLTKVFTPLIK